MLGRNFFHQLHRELVMVSGNIRSRVDRRQLVLCGCNLIVFGFGKDPQLPKFFVQLGHKSLDARLDCAEIMVLQFLPLGRFSAK